MGNRNRKVIMSLAYKFAERVGVKLIAFAISIVFARLLEPAAFGLLTILTVFVNLSQVFVQGGLNVALIQSKEADEKDYSTVFWINLVVAIFLYALLFGFAPVISSYYQTGDLILPLRVLSLSLIFGAFNSVQTAQLSREMRFDSQMVCNLITTVLAALVGITMVYHGYGLWSLVAYNLLNQVFVCFTMMFVVRWRPRFEFSRVRAIELFRYGWKILISNILYSLYTDIRSLIIAKVYTTEELAYYDRGNQLPGVISLNIDTVIQSVMLPTLSKNQDEKEKILLLLNRMVRTGTYLITPLMIGLVAISKQFVLLFLSDKWLDSVPYIIIFSIGYICIPVSSSCNVAIKAIGRVDVFVKNQAIRIVTMFAILIISVLAFHNVIAIAIGYTVSLFAEMLIAIWPARKLLNYSYRNAFSDFAPNLIVSLLMGVIVYLIGALQINTAALLPIQIFAGVLSYIGLSWVFHIESFIYAISIAKQLMSRNNH